MAAAQIKELLMSKKQGKNVVKAYHNKEFITSPDGRIVRVVCEFLEPKRRLRKHKVKDTIVFFGSARALSSKDMEKSQKELGSKVSRLKGAAKKKVQGRLEELKHLKHLCKYYDDAMELSKMLTKWSAGLPHPKRRFIVTSGGGGGIMEAANRGATELAKGKSIGFNISIPHEQLANPYITPDLNFEFHYFFIRKFWFVYLAKALVIFPGGFGTLDELMEVLTLIQTEKVKKKIPIIVYGPEYWNKIINLREMARAGAIDERDLKLFKFASTPKEAFNYLSKELTRQYL